MAFDLAHRKHLCSLATMTNKLQNLSSTLHATLVRANIIAEGTRITDRVAVGCVDDGIDIGLRYGPDSLQRLVIHEGRRLRQRGARGVVDKGVCVGRHAQTANSKITFESSRRVIISYATSEKWRQQNDKGLK